MGMQGLQRLEVWKRAKDFALRIYRGGLPFLTRNHQPKVTRLIECSMAIAPIVNAANKVRMSLVMKMLSTKHLNSTTLNLQKKTDIYFIHRSLFTFLCSLSFIGATP
jgi:hypothetical protein